MKIEIEHDDWDVATSPLFMRISFCAAFIMTLALWPFVPHLEAIIPAVAGTVLFVLSFFVVKKDAVRK